MTNEKNDKRTDLLCPQWYAEYKYQQDKPFREAYIENALDPYAGAYAFYTIRKSLRRKQLLEAAELERERQAKIRAKQRNKPNWRSKVKFIF